MGYHDVPQPRTHIYADASDEAGNMGASAAVTFVVGNGDKASPTAPTGLTVTEATTPGLTLAWNASRYDVGIAGYGVYKNGADVA